MAPFQPIWRKITLPTQVIALSVSCSCICILRDYSPKPQLQVNSAQLWAGVCGGDDVIAKDFPNLAAQHHEHPDPALMLALLLARGWAGGL